MLERHLVTIDGFHRELTEEATALRKATVGGAPAGEMREREGSCLAAAGVTKLGWAMPRFSQQRVSAGVPPHPAVWPAHGGPAAKGVVSSTRIRTHGIRGVGGDRWGG